MAIELLDVQKQWGKIKAAFNTSLRLYKTPPAPKSYPFVNGIDPLTEQARYSMPRSMPSAFGGKTFNQRSK